MLYFVQDEDLGVVEVSYSEYRVFVSSIYLRKVLFLRVDKLCLRKGGRPNDDFVHMCFTILVLISF